MTEASIGKREAQELAVMVDTFYPLHLTTDALEYEKPEYQSTWLGKRGVRLGVQGQPSLRKRRSKSTRKV